MDIARCVTRFASTGALEAGRTPNAKLLMETPPAHSLASPEDTQPASNVRVRAEQGSAPKKGVASVSGESSSSGDFARTDPQQTLASPERSRRGLWGPLLGAAVLVLGGVGYGLWARHTPTASDRHQGER